MKKLCFAPLFAIVLAFPVLAQSPNPYDGTWAVSFDGQRTADLEGTVVVKDGGGMWKVLAKSRKNPCIGREAPITVKTASADELVFEINRSKVLTGCEDLTMKFKKVDGTTLSGKTSSGAVILLTRQ